MDVMLRSMSESHMYIEQRHTTHGVCVCVYVCVCYVCVCVCVCVYDCTCAVWESERAS